MVANSIHGSLDEPIEINGVGQEESGQGPVMGEKNTKRYCAGINNQREQSYHKLVP